MNYFLGIRSVRWDASPPTSRTTPPVQTIRSPAPRRSAWASGITPRRHSTERHGVCIWTEARWQILVGSYTPRSDSIQHAALATSINSSGTAAGFFEGRSTRRGSGTSARSAADIQATMGGPLPTPPRNRDRPMGAQRSHGHDDGRQLGPRQPRDAHERPDVGGRLPIRVTRRSRRVTTA